MNRENYFYKLYKGADMGDVFFKIKHMYFLEQLAVTGQMKRIFPQTLQMEFLEDDMGVLEASAIIQVWEWLVTNNYELFGKVEP